MNALNRSRNSEGELTHPVAYLICNQTPPAGDVPSLMSFEEVETLFHEFGHGLQHMLTTVEHPQAAGINNVEWDAVELPSQFMENWCLDRQTLMGMARHWQTGEPLPEEDYNKLRNSRTFMQGCGTLRQVHFALTDLRLHSAWSPELGQSPDAFRRSIADNTTVLRTYPGRPIPLCLRPYFCWWLLRWLLLLQVGRGLKRRCFCRFRGSWPRSRSGDTSHRSTLPQHCSQPRRKSKSR